MAKTWAVVVPIAGHAYIEVDADTEEEALEKAIDGVTSDHFESWEALEQFNQGNVCYCPRPWQAEVNAFDDDE